MRIENRIGKLEEQQPPSGRQWPSAIFVIGVHPQGTKTCNAAIVPGKKQMNRLPGETQNDFKNRVIEAVGGVTK